MDSILITGCNRGLGLGLVRCLLQWTRPPRHIFATCRSRDNAPDLDVLAAKNPNIHILEIDLCDFNRYEEIVKEIDLITNNSGLNVLFNNAGIAPKSTKITATKRDDLMNTFETNTVAPIMLSQACLPLLKKAAKANANCDMGIQRAAILNMSSLLGSIAENEQGGLYAYRASKAALNAATKSLSRDLSSDGILCVALHPGWVRTGLGGANAPLDVETSVGQLWETIVHLNEEHNGGFYQYNGKQLPCW